MPLIEQPYASYIRTVMIHSSNADLAHPTMVGSSGFNGQTNWAEISALSSNLIRRSCCIRNNPPWIDKFQDGPVGVSHANQEQVDKQDEIWLNGTKKYQ